MPKELDLAQYAAFLESMSVSPHLPKPGHADQDERQAYIAEALHAARLMAGTLEYLINTQRSKEHSAIEPLCAVLLGLRHQAGRVIDFLEEIKAAG